MEDWSHLPEDDSEQPLKDQLAEFFCEQDYPAGVAEMLTQFPELQSAENFLPYIHEIGNCLEGVAGESSPVDLHTLRTSLVEETSTTAVQALEYALGITIETYERWLNGAETSNPIAHIQTEAIVAIIGQFFLEEIADDLEELQAEEDEPEEDTWGESGEFGNLGPAG